MSTTDNNHRKVLTTNALKTNFISNTNPKNKSENQKRFSNISKEKQTIQKNTARYHQQTDMQGSATIVPQKSSSRQNIYANQNANYPNQNGINSAQIGHTQRKELNQGNLNIKAKSPISNNSINIQLNEKNQPKLAQTKKFSKNSQLKTQRQQSANSYRKNEDSKDQFKFKSLIINDYRKNENPKDQFKIKSLIINNKSQIDEEYYCTQELDYNIIPQKQHVRKLSNNFVIKNDGSQSTINQQFNERTQKKYLVQKSTLMTERTNPQNTMVIRQQQIIPAGLNNALVNGNVLNNITKTANQISNNSNFQTLINRQGSKHHLPLLINPEEQLRKFLNIQTQMNLNAEIQTLLKLQARQKEYLVQPNYIESRQKHLNWFMRAVLMDWMMQVCFEFGLKRQTCYISLSLVDKYLQKTNDLPKSEFQLIGAACMFIAAKLQEFQALSSTDFSKSTDNRYSHNQIKSMEFKVCRTMNYQLNPPTLYMWANRFMVHWDNYIQMTNAKFHNYFQDHSPKYFKRQSQDSYLLFRQMMQMLDCSMLDVQTLQFAPKTLVCSFMYLILGKSYKEWSTKRIFQEFPRSSHYLITGQQITCFNHLFHLFLSDSFQIDICELLPAIQYCSTYFTLSLNYDTPCVLKNENQENDQLSLEEYESYQTYNGKMIDLIKKRYRGVYL